eukprot:4030832-Prymnesium_polylepis.1
MVKQYFAAPASSAGVERVFSAAGKMHDDLKKSAKDETLEHSIIAAFNWEKGSGRARSRSRSCCTHASNGSLTDSIYGSM